MLFLFGVPSFGVEHCMLPLNLTLLCLAALPHLAAEYSLMTFCFFQHISSFILLVFLRALLQRLMMSLLSNPRPILGIIGCGNPEGSRVSQPGAKSWLDHLLVVELLVFNTSE